MFPEGLSFDKKGFGTPVTHSIYKLLASDSVDEAVLVAPQGFEPRLIGSEPTVLPLNEGAKIVALLAFVSRTECSLTAL
jgi:hypothetical protein